MNKKIYILTLFPEFFSPLLECGVVGNALRGQRGEIKFEVELINIRDYSTNKYKSVDDTPYGGGPGMVMRADILESALLKGVVEKFNYGGDFKEKLEVIYPSPRGRVWNNTEAREFAAKYQGSKDLVFICGRYEGIDERFLARYVDCYYSVGDYVLSGGEIAVMTILDSSMRFVPGVLLNQDSAIQDSFEDGLIECPQYTKPREFHGELPPEPLINGHHQKILDFQKEEKIRMTKFYRPDLYAAYLKDKK